MDVLARLGANRWRATIPEQEALNYLGSTR
jgi:hypothetical protein